MVARGEKGEYQPFRIESSSYRCINFRRETKTRVNSLADEQSGYIRVHKKNGGYSESKNKSSKQIMVEISNREWDRKNSRISPREARYFSGQDILKKGQQPMEIKPYISETVLCKGSSRNKSFYRQSDNSVPRVLLLGNKPLESGSK